MKLTEVCNGSVRSNSLYL